MTKLGAWARQPTTVAGLSALLGTVCALFLRQITWPAAIPLLVGAATSMVLQDNAGAKQQAESLATTVIAEVVHH